MTLSWENLKRTKSDDSWRDSSLYFWGWLGRKIRNIFKLFSFSFMLVLISYQNQSPSWFILKKAIATVYNHQKIYILVRLSKIWTNRSQLIFRWKLNGTNKYWVIHGLTQKLNRSIYKSFHYRIVQFVFEHAQTNTSLVVSKLFLKPSGVEGCLFKRRFLY